MNHKTFKTWFKLWKGETRLIFDASKSTEAVKLEQTQEFLCSEIEKAKFSGIDGKDYDSKRLAKLFRKRQLHQNILQEVKDLATNPNKTSKDEVKMFLKALSKGKFPDKGENALLFLHSLLDGTPQEKAHAKKLVEGLSGSKKLSETQEKAELKHLKDLREQDQQEEALKQTGAKVNSIMKAAETGEQVRKITERPASRVEEEPPPKEIERLAELTKKKASLMEDSNKFAAELDRKEHELEKTKALRTQDNAKIQTLEKEIASLNSQIEKIDQEVEALSAETERLRPFDLDYQARMLARKNAVAEFSKEVGFDIEKVGEIIIEGAKREIKVDKRTGEATKPTEKIRIKRIRFENDETQEGNMSGRIIIEFRDENGTLTAVNDLTFKNIINGLNGYEDVETLEALNRNVREELRATTQVQSLQKGQTYTSEKEKEFQFKIEDINETTGEITIDRVVTAIPKEWLSSSINNAFYFDKKKRTFKYGEFQKFLMQFRFKRNIQDSEVQDAIDGKAERDAETSRTFATAFTPGQQEVFEKIGGILDPKDRIVIPKPGEKIRVQFKADRDKDNGVGRYGYLENSNGRLALMFSSKQPRQSIFVPTVLEEGGPDPRISEENRGTFQRIELSPQDLLHLIERDELKKADPPIVVPPLSFIKRKSLEASNKEMEDKDMVEPAIHEEHEEEGEETHGEDYEGAHEGERGEHAEHKESGTGHAEKSAGAGDTVPYNETYKHGGMAKIETSYVASLWTSTKFFSIDDLWQMGKSMYEYYVRRFERRQKGNFSEVGKDLPFFAPEMRRIYQAEENQMVNDFKESMDQKGMWEVEERLHKTKNKDEFKAAIMTLVEKGEIRWDDINLWKQINKWARPDKAIPIPSNGDPYTHMSEHDDRTGFEFLKDSIDSIWGENTYNEWYSSNKSHYTTHMKDYYEEGNELEGKEGGHEIKLAFLLKKHKEGGYVSPHEYEGIINHAIVAGKTTVQAKIYYIIEGLTAKNHEGKTILSYDRMSHIASENITRFPLVDYLCPPAPIAREGKALKFTLDDYRRWADWFDMGNPMNCRPTKAVIDFMWKYAIPSEHTHKRINKALRNGDNIDHDDMFAYIPPATESVVKNSCKKLTGDKYLLTTEGYANVFPGFNQYMRALAENDNRNKLVEAIKSYVIYEGIQRNRYKKGNEEYYRMDERTLSTPTVVSNGVPMLFIGQCNAAMKEIVAEYNDVELNGIAAKIYDESVGNVREKSEKAKQDEIDYAFEQFGKVFNRVVKKDKGQKMTEIILKNNFTGMQDCLSKAEQDQRKSLEHKNELDVA